MLYDPKWECKTETKADPFTLAGLIAWLEKQPADEQYNYFSIHGCLICKYLDGIGIKYHSAGGSDFAHPDPLPGRTHLPGFMAVAYPHPWTFGDALERARAALVSSPQ